MKLTHENLEGTWIVSRSEIDHVKPGDETYQFIPPDVLKTQRMHPSGRLHG